MAQQLEAKKKCREKLPLWFGTRGIYYPNKLHIAQSSSETTAAYKAQIVSGKSLLDATGGFGVDSYFFGQKMKEVVHCELKPELLEIAAYNFGVFGIKNIQTMVGNGIDFLKKTELHFDWIYLDPSRRNEQKGKVFTLVDSLPNVPEHLMLLFSKSDRLLIKTSPLLDFSIGIQELQFVREIHVVAVRNEVRELLWVLEKGYGDAIAIKTVNFTKKGPESFNFGLSEEKSVQATYAMPMTYLYEPNAAILKSGAFKTVGNRFQLKKLQEHSHLYTADRLVDFPGRRFRITKSQPYGKKALLGLDIPKANITTRNFPMTVSALRKRFQIKDGGDRYLFFTTDQESRSRVLVCTKVPEE
ncbi:class I SAM-dependent methyltransferase [Flavobacteriaceae bacterium 3-367]